jgi:hypothetical protein
MATQGDVRRIALTLPGTVEGRDHFAFSVEIKGKLKGYAWVWMERVHPKKARVPCPSVLAVRVRDEAEKAALLAGDPERFFTEPHYNGFPAVLVRLPRVSSAQLRALLLEAWRCMAPKHLLDQTPAPVRKRAGARRGSAPSRPRAARGPR